MANSEYVIVPAPGHYGDKTRVLSAHRTLSAARRAKGRDNTVVIRPATPGLVDSKGDEWLRVYEETAPIVQ